MSFFWQSRRHLSKLNDLKIKRHNKETETISSPLRRIHQSGFEKVLALSPVPELRSKFLTPGDLAPQEIMSIQSRHTDYVCGVERKGRVCKNTLYCSKHTLFERKLVKRSKPLVELMRTECDNQTLYARRRKLAESFFNCKSYWIDQEQTDRGLKTCDHSSCSSSTSESYHVSPKVTSQSTICLKSENGWRSKLLKASYLKKITENAAINPDNVVSYLFYKLRSYESIDMDLRAREQEIRFERRMASAQ